MSNLNTLIDKSLKEGRVSAQNFQAEKQRQRPKSICAKHSLIVTHKQPGHSSSDRFKSLRWKAHCQLHLQRKAALSGRLWLCFPVSCCGWLSLRVTLSAPPAASTQLSLPLRADLHAARAINKIQPQLTHRDSPTPSTGRRLFPHSLVVYKQPTDQLFTLGIRPLHTTKREGERVFPGSEPFGLGFFAA